MLSPQFQRSSRRSRPNLPLDSVARQSSLPAVNCDRGSAQAPRRLAESLPSLEHGPTDAKHIRIRERRPDIRPCAGRGISRCACNSVCRAAAATPRARQLRRLSRIHPLDPAAFGNLGSVLAQLALLSEAQLAFARLRELRPLDPTVCQALGRRASSGSVC